MIDFDKEYRMLNNNLTYKLKKAESDEEYIHNGLFHKKTVYTLTILLDGYETGIMEINKSLFDSIFKEG